MDAWSVFTLVLTSPFTKESAHVTLSYLVGPTLLPVVCCHPPQCICPWGETAFLCCYFLFPQLGRQCLFLERTRWGQEDCVGLPEQEWELCGEGWGAAPRWQTSLVWPQTCFLSNSAQVTPQAEEGPAAAATWAAHRPSWERLRSRPGLPWSARWLLTITFGKSQVSFT